MVVLSNLKQLMRTPLKTLFFFILLKLAITFFMLGFNLWSIAGENMRRLESTFVTIGTVEQKATSLEMGAQWDAEKKAYSYHAFPIIGDAVPTSVLDFPGANYIHKPEKRPYYCAYSPDYNIVTDPLYAAQIEESTLIVEMQPESDCETGDPVPVKITKVLMGPERMNGNIIMFCNHFEEKTYKLYADKTYIVGLGYWPSHVGYENYSEYTPWGLNFIQTTKEGKRVEAEAGSSTPWEEVTAGFYETPEGKHWLDYIDIMKEFTMHAIPVIPTNFTKLLMPFFNGEARVMEGRDISDSEYANGDNVCLVSKSFAEKNGLTVGGSLPLPFVYADYSAPPTAFFQIDGDCGGRGFLNAKGEPYTPFDCDTYKIVGIYDLAPSAGSSSYTLAGNTVVIPSASVTNSDENNIIFVGPMRGYSTSFQIPNGTIDKFMAAMEAQGIDDLEITFFDKGYSKIKAGLDEIKSTAILLFTVGGVTTLFTIILFCHLFITKQRRRTAIERSMGISKTLCTISLLVCVLAVTVPAFIFGSLASNYLTGYTARQMNVTQAEEAFDTTFSDWVNSADNDLAVDATISMEGGGTEAYFAGAAVIPAALLIALITIRGNLKQEPLKLLSEKER